MMLEPNPGGPRPLDLLIATSGIVVTVVVAAWLAVWDFVGRTVSRNER